MSVRALFDVNLLIALLQPDHMHHDPAHKWWSENDASGWASCPLTENGFLRIVSQPRYGNPMPVAAAIGRFREWIADTDHVFWPDDLSLADQRRFVSHRILGPNQLTDIYLLGLAVKNDGRLATFDRTIPTTAVGGAKARHLVVI